jgi:hypothetical protein
LQSRHIWRDYLCATERIREDAIAIDADMPSTQCAAA